MITKKIEADLDAAGFSSASTSIDGEYKNANLEIHYVIVKLNPDGIEDEKGHIHNVEKVVDIVNRAIKIEKDRIVIYE